MTKRTDPTPPAHALLDEIGAPEHVCSKRAADGVLAFLPVLEKIRTQAARYQSLAQAVKIGEPDAEVRARFEHCFQTVAAMLRHIGEAEAATHALVEDFRALERYDAETREFMRERGYAG